MITREWLGKIYIAVSLGLVIGFCWYLLDSRYRGTHVDPLGSSGQTWYVVMHDMRDQSGAPTIHEADGKPIVHSNGVVEFKHNGDLVVISDNWSMYRMQHR